MTGTPWSVPNKWRGKTAVLGLADVNCVSLNRPDDDSPSYWLADSASYALGLSKVFPPDSGAVVVYTDERRGIRWLHPANVHRLGRGLSADFDRDTSKLSGRHMLPRAISLAVHLGASTIIVDTSDVYEVATSTVRNLADMCRALKRRRVRVLERCGTRGRHFEFWQQEPSNEDRP